MNILHWWREDEADYVQAIQSLKAEKPLPLPAIQPLKAKRVSSTQTVKVAAIETYEYMRSQRR